MNAVRWIVLVGCALTACGGAASDTVAPTVAETVPVTTMPVTTMPATTMPATSESSPTSVEEPDAGDDVDDASSLILAIEPALLPEGAFAAPWEPQWRTVDNIAYGTGGNQTDCAPYWTLESMRGGRGGGHAMWWVDGGNANHYVSRLDEPVTAKLLELATLAADCPVVNWNEGGTFEIESIPISDGLGFRLVDVGTNETTWIGMTTYGDLLSVIDVPLWLPVGEGDVVDFGTDDLDRLVTQMSKLLRSAPVLPSVPVTTLPGTRPRPTNQPPTTSMPPQSATTTTIATTVATTTPIPTTTTTTLPLPDDLVRLLLDTQDLPAEFGDVELRRHEAGEPDDELAAQCPAAESVNRIDLIFEVSGRANTREGLDFSQIVGRADTSQEAVELVEQFAALAACDLSSSFGGETEVTGGTFDLPPADAAARLAFDADELGFQSEIVLFSVGDIISTFNVASTEVDPDLVDDLARRAVERIVAHVGG